MDSKTILIVEDEAIVAADLASKLKQMGYRIAGPTPTGEGAVELAREERPDLILMDIRLAGDVDGIETAEIIRREHELPVIFLTAHSDRATLERARIAEAFGYILKPFEERELATAIEMALYKHHAEQKLRRAHDELELRVEERTRELVEAEKRLREMNETLEQRVAERTRELAEANELLTQSRQSALDMMEEALAARNESEEANAELRRSEERYRLLFDNMLNGFAYCRMIFDAEGGPCDFVYLDVNESFARLTGLENVIGRKVTDVIPGIREGAPELLEAYGRVALTGRPEAFEVDFKPLDKWLSISVYSPKKEHFAAVFDDITERKRAEEALRESERQFRIMGETVPYGVWLCGPDGGVRYCSDSFLELIDMTQEEQRQFGWTRRLVPEDMEPMMEKWLHCCATGSPWEHEHRIVDREGEIHTILSKGLPVRDDTGKITCWTGVNLDITERKKAEEALQESELFYRQMLESIPGMVFTTRPDGYCEYQSQQWVDFTGVPMSEHLGCGWNRLLHPDDRDRALAAWNAAVEGTAPYDLEYRVRRHDGAFEWFKVRGRPIRNECGEIVRWFGTAVNIDDLYKTREALQESEQRVRRKLESILIPEGDIGSLDLADIIDTNSLQPLVEKFFQLTNMTMGLIDLKGNILVGVGWRDICVNFHRINPESCRNCVESDTVLSSSVPQGEFKLYKCKNNLWDVATPVIIAGRHFGNLFMGQFFLENETIDYGLFRSQAARYGFDEEKYIEALDAVPRLNRETLTVAMGFFIELAEMLSRLSYGNLKLARAISERDMLMSSVHKSNSRLNLLAGTAEELLRTHSPQAIVEVLCTKVMEFLDCHAFFNFLVDEERGGLRLNACAGMGREEAARIEWIDYGTAVCGCAARDDCRIVAEDVAHSSDPRVEVVKSYGIRAYACHPLTVQGRVLGTLSFGTRSRDSFSEDDLSLMKAVADQVAMAMEHKRATEELQAARDEMEMRVEERTEELAAALDSLQEEMQQRRETEDMLRSNEALLRTVFETLPVGVEVFDQQGKLTYLNRAARNIWYGDTAATPGEKGSFQGRLQGKAQPMKPDEWPQMRAILHTEQVVGQIIDIEAADGTKKTVICSAAPIRDAGDTVTGAVFVAEDITSQREIQEQLLHAQKMDMIGRLAGGIAHDFNNLLTIISGFAEHVLEEISDDSARTSLGHVINASGRAKDLAQKLLTFSSQQVMQVRPFDLRQAVDEMLRLLRRLIGEHIEVSTDFSEVPLVVEGDCSQIEQVVTNLILNARDAMPAGGKLFLTVARAELAEGETGAAGLPAGDYGMVEICDNGTGIAPDILPRIFEPFFSTKEIGKGTGLGLSIAYGIARQHRGAVTVDSTPGKGSAFRVYLPLLQEEADDALEADSHVVTRSGSETLLLVEDDPSVRLFLRITLQRAGYGVIEANDGEEALRLAETACFDLLLTDVIMPKMNGMQLLESLKGKYPGTKAVFMSGYSADILPEGMDQTAFLQKPVAGKVLLAKVREVLGG